jgi:hypothetical protein
MIWRLLSYVTEVKTVVLNMVTRTVMADAKNPGMEKIVDVGYLGTNQNGIIVELLTVNTYKYQRTHSTCIYSV